MAKKLSLEGCTCVEFSILDLFLLKIACSDAVKHFCIGLWPPKVMFESYILRFHLLNGFEVAPVLKNLDFDHKIG